MGGGCCVTCMAGGILVFYRKQNDRACTANLAAGVRTKLALLVLKYFCYWHMRLARQLGLGMHATRARARLRSADPPSAKATARGHSNLNYNSRA